MKVLQCETCAGRLVLAGEGAGVACAFCGRPQLKPVPETLAAPPAPAHGLRLGIDAAAARDAFAGWAARRRLAPGALRAAAQDLRLVYLPLWRFRGQLEVHWAGLRATPFGGCGWVPDAGSLEGPFEQDVCASGALSAREVAQLLPVDEADMQPWDAASVAAPWEPAQLSEQRAWPQAIDDAARQRMARHMRETSLDKARSMQYAPRAPGQLRMLPVYIATLRYLGRDWRFVVSAQHGKVAGQAPYSWLKLGAIAAAALLLLAWLVA